MSHGRRVLVIAGLGSSWVDGEKRNGRDGKIKCHVWPIADAADHVDFVSPGPNPSREDGITYWRVSSSNKYLTLLKVLWTALVLSRRNDYDLIASFSLLPYGLFALVVGLWSRTPSHLGIIGGDLDVHSTARYGLITRWLFRRFDIVTVAGKEFQRRVASYGVPRERIFTVLHPVDKEYAGESAAKNPKYDILWLTRVSEVKDPLMFVDILSELRDRSVGFSAALVGSGSMDEQVMDAIEEEGLEDVVDVPGWTDSPEEYYRNAKVYVMTSRREMLPLTLVEAMLVGTPPVVPSLGGIPDIVNDGENGIVVGSRDVEEYADALENLLTNEQFRRKLASNAPEVESELSYEAVADSWREIFGRVAKSSRSK